MDEGRLPDVSFVTHEPGADMTARVEALRLRGAADFDPVGLCVIEAMLRRLDAHEGPAHAALLNKIERRLAVFCECFARAGGTSRAKGVEGTALAIPEPGQLTALLAHIARQSGSAEDSTSSTHFEDGAKQPPELKSLRYFRRSWSRLSLEQQLSRALAQAPENAGPLNSHFLMLQSLIRMRDIAPGYLENFIVYAEALLWLEQADPGRGGGPVGASQKGASRRTSVRKTDTRAVRDAQHKTGRGRTV